MKALLLGMKLFLAAGGLPLPLHFPFDLSIRLDAHHQPERSNSFRRSFEICSNDFHGIGCLAGSFVAGV
jgi:hypothetical protein